MKTTVEIRAAEGGEDSKLLVRELYKIYVKACNRNDFRYELLSETPSNIVFCL
jgi:protein subunit release factor A